MDTFRRWLTSHYHQKRTQLDSLSTNSQVEPEKLQPTSPVQAPAQASVHFTPNTGSSPPSRQHRSRRHKSKHTSKHSHAMSSVTMSGPECKDILNFKKSIASIPKNIKAPFEAISKDTQEKVTDANALTVWESDADIDGLLQLTEVFFKIKAANASTNSDAGAGWGGKSSSKKAMGMVIISQEKDDRDAHQRIIELMRHLTETRGENHLNGAACAFDTIVVVRGINYTNARSKDSQKEAIRRINISLERVLEMTRRSDSKKPKIVWHHGPIISLLLFWINTTTPELRSALSAISITAALTFADGLKPSSYGKQNTPEDLQTLEKYATKLGIPVLFLDPITQLIHNEYLSHFICYFGYYITLFLPSSVTRPHYDKALDHLTTFAFRLWAATNGTYGEAVVHRVKQHLNGTRAQRWAKSCIDPKSYTKAASVSAGDEVALQHAASLADSPWAMYSTSPVCPLPSLTRLPLCPTEPAGSIANAYTAAPVSFHPSTSSYRVSNPSPFRLLIPCDGTDVGTTTARIQGTFTAILARVLEVKKTRPGIGESEARDWGDCLGAVSWALGECMPGLPGEVKGKAECVARMLVVSGCWGYLVKNTEGRGGGEKATGWSAPN